MIPRRRRADAFAPYEHDGQTILGYLFRNSHEVGTKIVTKRGEMNFKLDNPRVFPFFVLVAACLSGQVDSYPQNLMVTKSFENQNTVTWIVPAVVPSRFDWYTLRACVMGSARGMYIRLGFDLLGTDRRIWTSRSGL